MKRVLLVCSLVSISLCCARAEQTLTAEQVLQHHIDSVGSSAALAGAKSRVIVGTAFYRILPSGGGEFPGKAVMASNENKFHTLLKTDAHGHRGERFIDAGNGKISVAAAYSSFERSDFGDFLQGESVPLQDGLLGGVLTTAWPLTAVNYSKETFQYEGLKKFDGVELHVVSYKPKQKTGLKITLFFEPQTFRHVRSVYSETGETDLATTPVRNQRGRRSRVAASTEVRTGQRPTVWTIEENFGNFKTVDGLTLPFHYDLRFQEQLQGDVTNTIEWEVRVTGVKNNIPVDARNFEIH